MPRQVRDHEIQSPDLSQTDKGGGKRERDWKSEQNKAVLFKKKKTLVNI